MSARRVLLFTTMAVMVGTMLSPAQGTVPVPASWGVEVSGEDEFGNQLEGQAFFTRVADPNSQNDKYFITCEVHATSAAAAAVGINQSISGTPRNSDGCYLTRDNVPVFNAPGVGLSGEEASTSSGRNSGATYYLHNNAGGGEFEVCINARALFTTGGLVVASGCGNAQADPEPSAFVTGSGRYVLNLGEPQTGDPSSQSSDPESPDPGFPVLIECDAVASPGALETSVDFCALMRDGAVLAAADPAAFPGVASTTSAAAAIHYRSGLQVCWMVSAEFAGERIAYEESCSSSGAVVP